MRTSAAHRTPALRDHDSAGTPNYQVEIMKTSRILALPLLATAALAVGCSDGGSPSGPGGTLSGTVSFTSTGGVAGSFNVTGAVSSGSGQQFGTWAAGAREGSEFWVVATRSQSAQQGDMFALYAPSVTGTGPVTISEDCEGDCPVAMLMTNISTTGQSTNGSICSLYSGTINITAISAERARGTFSGEGECFNMQGQESPFAISNGSFDVPVVPNLNLPD